MKEKNKIIVETCSDCPFCQTEYDDFAIGESETNTCILLMDYSNKTKQIDISYFINFYKNGNVKSKNKKTLDNCPLLNQDYLITLKH